MRHVIRQVLGAVQFLTIIPVNRTTVPPAQSAIFFPAVGAVLGGVGGVLLESGREYLPFALLSLLVLSFWSVITGGLHEDAVADVADAFRALRPPEVIHRILKDSHIGAHGVLALVLLVLIRWQALSSIAADIVPALAAALGISRSSIVVLAAIAPPAGEASGASFARGLSTQAAALVAAQAILLALWPGGRISAFLTGGSLAIILLAKAYFTRRIGGVTGDCLGTTSQLVETWCFLVYTCRPCIS